MKRAVVVLVLVLVGLSCFVDRKSSELECDDDTDCTGFDDMRTCQDQVCLPVTCPGICDDCDPGMVCKISCSSGNECGNGVTCPAGWNCEFECNQNCTPVNCSLGLSCTVDCGINRTCGPLTCGNASPCTCSGTGCL